MTRRARDTFYFKHFSVKHDKCAHKVGTDGVLLGAWTNVKHAKRILDVGTGTGVIALMLAQRTSEDVHIDAIDLAKEDCDQANENFSASPWQTKLRATHSSLQAYDAPPYDLIVSNPPFFINSAKPPDAERLRARHTETLSLNDLITNAIRLLHKTGRLSVVLPTNEGEYFIAAAREHQFYCIRRCEFYSREHKPLERLLLEFGFQETSCETEKLLLYEKDEIWTEGYKALTRDFYLKA